MTVGFCETSSFSAAFAGDQPHSDAHADDVLTPVIQRQPGANVIATSSTGSRRMLPVLEASIPPTVKVSIISDRTAIGVTSISAQTPSLPSCDPLAGGMELKDTAFKQSKLNVQRERGSAAMR